MRFLVKLNDAVMILLADSKKWVQIHTLLWLGLWIVTEQLSASSISGYVYLPAYIYIYQQLQNIYFVLVPVCCNMDTLLYTGLMCVPFCGPIFYSNNLQ